MRAMQTILLVDDEPDAVEIYAMLLEMRGYRVISASNGDEALRQIGEIRPDVIVTDWMMPIMDGAELCSRLRAETSPYRDIPIVVASAAMQLPEGVQDMYDAFVRKPITIDDLIDVLESVAKGPAGSSRPQSLPG